MEVKFFVSFVTVARIQQLYRIDKWYKAGQRTFERENVSAIRMWARFLWKTKEYSHCFLVSKQMYFHCVSNGK